VPRDADEALACLDAWGITASAAFGGAWECGGIATVFTHSTAATDVE
jgi:hypothetical protein